MHVQALKADRLLNRERQRERRPDIVEPSAHKGKIGGIIRCVLQGLLRSHTCFSSSARSAPPLVPYAKRSCPSGPHDRSLSRPKRMRAY